MLFSDSIPDETYLPLFDFSFSLFFLKPCVFGSRLRDFEVKVTIRHIFNATFCCPSKVLQIYLSPYLRYNTVTCGVEKLQRVAITI